MRTLLTLSKRSYSVFFSLSNMKIGTHNGPFHCDEVLATFMLKKLPEYKDAGIVRSRDQTVLDNCDIVVDVGGTYDHSKQLYDHHQREFTSTMESLRPDISTKVKLSSAGLIYHHYGERVIESILGKSLDKIMMKHMFKYVYDHFIKEIDAVDNGVPMYEVGEPLYQYNTHLSARVAQLHPPWNALDDREENWMLLFNKAMDMVGTELISCIKVFYDVWWPARSLVQTAIENRFTIHPSGSVIEVPLCPWKQHLFDVELEQDIQGIVKYAIFDEGKTWRVQAVPLTPGNFKLRSPLYPTWQGLRDEQLAAVTGVSDAVFIHSNGFIGGAKSRSGALALADKSIKLYEQAES